MYQTPQAIYVQHHAPHPLQSACASVCRGSGAPKPQAASADDSKARERFGSAKSISSAQFNNQVRTLLEQEAGFI